MQTWLLDFCAMTRLDRGANEGSTARHEVLTLAELVVAGACAVRTSLSRALAIELDHVDEGSWNRLTVEYAVLHLYLLSEHAHQVLRESEAHSLIGEIADRVGHRVSHRLGATRTDQRAVVLFFGETLKERFASYHGQPIVVDPGSGEELVIESFERLRGTVFASFVEALVPLLSAGPGLAPRTLLDLWLDSLNRSEAFGRVYTPVVDLFAANRSAPPVSAPRA